MNPIIRWAGSKRKLLSKLKTYWSGGSTRYVEPFCGSACLFFDLEPQAGILGDLNSELISTYETLRRNAGRVYEMLRTVPETAEVYYRMRDMDPAELNETEKAVRFLYLNRHCFNGIYRTNRDGRFNVPRGKKTSSRAVDFERLFAAAELLKRVSLINGDFSATLQQVQKGDFVYLDPPYAVADRRIFAEYHPNSFVIDDLERLSNWLVGLNRLGATFVVSYADSTEARRLLAPWQPRRVWTRRHVAGFATDRRGAYEIIASNINTYAE